MAAQSQCAMLTDEKFEQLTRAWWALISAGNVNTWQRQDHIVLEEFAFNVFPCTLTGSQLQECPCWFALGSNVFQNPNGNTTNAATHGAEQLEMGPITLQHLAMHQTHQLEGVAFTMPTNNMTRRVQFLDKR